MMVVRPAQVNDAEGIARVRVLTWKSTYRGLVPDSVLDNLSVEQTATSWKTRLGENPPQHFAFVVEKDKNIVGFSSYGKEISGDPVFLGELYAIYVLKEFHGQGIGRTLVQKTARGLLDIGFSSMLLWVFAGNHSAQRFYERMGGVYLRDKIKEIGGTPMLEKAYGWRNLQILTAEKG
jgi:ribosomal protein S18 acetylase RimI-like enzyme